MSTAVSDPLVGRLLDGRYEIVRRIARGGMATVYEASDIRLDRTVAVKVMHPGLAEDRDFVARFIREARSAARLSHPNVVAVFDQGTDDGNVYLAMEYVPGRTVRDVLRDRGRLSLRDALAIVEPALAALDAAHRAGLVHRDVKPENVLIADDGRVKVADFGLARAVASASTTVALIGTAAYLAPEQVERGVADPRSDVYAAGILLFELLTGRKPFTGENPIQVAYAHVHHDVPAPSALLPGVPAGVDQLVLSTTRRDPYQRPADAGAMLAATLRVHQSLSDAELDRLTVAPVGDPRFGAATDRTVVLNRARGGADPTGRTDTVVAPRDPADPYAPPEFLRHRRRGRLLLATVLAMTLLASGAAWWLGSGRYVAAPSLIEMDRRTAVATAQQAGLSVQFAHTGAFDERIPHDRVVRTDPKPGHRIARHGVIVAVLSMGPERYAVPKLAGLRQDDAQRALRATHLSVGAISYRYDAEVGKGRVLRSNPGRGQRLKRDAAVALVISKGAQPVALPNVIGQQVDQATNTLSGRGFRVSRRDRYDDQVPPGLVMNQDPTTSTAPRGSTVTLVVSRGPQLFNVPSVVGRKLKVAQQMLTVAGFQARVLVNFPGGPDRVVSQSPPGGSQRPKRSTVILTAI